MPSASELRASGSNDLALIVSRRGGFVAWAARLELPLKESETQFGQSWEKQEGAFFESLGLAVERQTTKAPFDFVVGGKRVDVKAGQWGEYGAVKGYFFAGLRRGTDCDVFDLVCVSEGRAKHRFIVPAEMARVQTVTITRSSIDGSGKYRLYLDAIEHLRN